MKTTLMLIGLDKSCHAPYINIRILLIYVVKFGHISKLKTKCGRNLE